MNCKLHRLLHMLVLLSLVKVKAKNIRQEQSLTGITDNHNQVLNYRSVQTPSKTTKPSSGNDDSITEIVDEDENTDNTNDAKKETAGELDNMVDRLFNNLLSEKELSEETANKTSPLSFNKLKNTETGMTSLKSSVNLVKNELESFKNEDMNDTQEVGPPQIAAGQKDTGLEVNKNDSDEAMMEYEGQENDNSMSSNQKSTPSVLPVKESAKSFKDDTFQSLKDQAKEIESEIQQEQLLLTTPKRKPKENLSIDYFKLKDPVVLRRLGKKTSVATGTTMAYAVNKTATNDAKSDQTNPTKELVNNNSIHIHTDADAQSIIGSSGTILKSPELQFSNVTKQASLPDSSKLPNKISENKPSTAASLLQRMDQKSKSEGSDVNLSKNMHVEHKLPKDNQDSNSAEQIAHSAKTTKEISEKPHTEQKPYTLDNNNNHNDNHLNSNEHFANAKTSTKSSPNSSINEENDLQHSKQNYPENTNSPKHAESLKITPIDNDSQDLSNWTPWSTCSATCGTNAIQIRTRKCMNANQNAESCKQKIVDWRPCINNAKTLICKETKERHKQTPLLFLSNLVNKTVSGTLENQNSRYQWGKWSSCPEKCGQKDIKVRRRICPGQRSFDTGVCMKPTMQWSWCNPKSCNEPKTGTTGNNQGFVQSAQNSNNFWSTNSFFKIKNIKPQDVVANATKDIGVHFTPKCTTTPWSAWSLCSRTCGENSRKYRTRSCSCTVRSQCDQPIIQWNHCTLSACSGEENYGPWTEFSRCTKSCGGGWKKRIRHCIKKHNVPASNRVCDEDLLIGVRVCNVHKCPMVSHNKGALVPIIKVQFDQTPHHQINMQPKASTKYKYSRRLVNDYIYNAIQPYEDSESSCGFVPCQEFGCLDNPYSKCESDSNCDPVFYDLSGNVHHRCTDWGRYFIRKPAMFCGYNPCISTGCQTSYAQCYVDLKCRPIVTEIDGSLVDCRQLIANTYKRRLYTSRPRYPTQGYQG